MSQSIPVTSPRRPALGGFGEGINQTVIGALTILIVKFVVGAYPAFFADSVYELGIVVMGVLNVLSNVLRTGLRKWLVIAIALGSLLALPGCATLSDHGINASVGITGTGGRVAGSVSVGGQGFGLAANLDLVDAGCFMMGLIPADFLDPAKGWCAQNKAAKALKELDGDR